MRLRRKTRGSLVLVAFCFTAIIAIALASYIAVCYQSLNLSTREYNSKRARYLAEVGLEESLWALNNSWTSSGKNSDQTWSTSGSDKTLTLDAANTSDYDLGAGAIGSLSLKVFNYATTPSIRSTATITLTDGSTYSKRFDATTQRASTFPNAIASASSTVSFSSDGVIDSFDSTTAYNNPSNMTYNAVIAGNTVALNNADVKGYVSTYGNAPTYGSGTVIGSGGSGVDTNRISKSAFIPLFPVTTPSPGLWSGTLTNNSPQTIGAIGGTTPQYWRFTGNYSLTSATLTVSGPVKIVISGNLTITGAGRLRVNNTSNAALEIFVGGNLAVGTVATAATNGFNNRSPSAAAPVPSNLVVYVTGSGSTVYHRSLARFDGIIYSSHASSGTMTIASTGQTAALHGALLSNNSITFSGATPWFHYDTDLRASTSTFAGVSTPFIINVLSELANER